MNWGDRRLPERFWDKVSPEPNGGCWLWTGVTVKGGYGRITVRGGRKELAHRFALSSVEALRAGMVTDHKCKVRCCVNPAHLEQVTQFVNVHRGDGMAAHRAKRTHCPRGHEYSGDNLRVFERSPGRFMRTCRACERGSR